MIMKSRFLSWAYGAAELQDRADVIQRLLKAITDVHVGTHERAMAQAEGDFVTGVNSLIYQQAYAAPLKTPFKPEEPATSKEAAVMDAIRDSVLWVRSPVYLPRILDAEIWDKEAPELAISSEYLEEPAKTASLDEAFQFAFFNLSRAAGKLVALQTVSMLLTYDYHLAEKVLGNSSAAIRDATWQKIARYERDMLLFAAMKGDPASLKVAVKTAALSSCWNPTGTSVNYEVSHFVSVDGKPRGYMPSTLAESLRGSISDAMRRL